MVRSIKKRSSKNKTRVRRRSRSLKVRIRRRSRSTGGAKGQEHRDRIPNWVSTWGELTNYQKLLDERGGITEPRISQGILRYANGDFYDGQFNNNDEKHGYGVMNYNDGRVLEGFWKDDKFDGEDPNKLPKPTLEEGLKSELEKILNEPKKHFPVFYGKNDFRCSMRSSAKTKLYETIKTLFYNYLVNEYKIRPIVERTRNYLRESILPNIHGNIRCSTIHYLKNLFNDDDNFGKEYGKIPWNIKLKKNILNDKHQLFKILISICLSEEYSHILKDVLKMKRNETFFETGCFLYDIADVLNYYLENEAVQKEVEDIMAQKIKAKNYMIALIEKAEAEANRKKEDKLRRISNQIIRIQEKKEDKLYEPEIDPYLAYKWS